MLRQRAAAAVTVAVASCIAGSIIEGYDLEHADFMLQQ